MVRGRAGIFRLAAVAELGVPPEEVIAFGDYPNEIPLLTWAGRGIAMGNAHSLGLERLEQ